MLHRPPSRSAARAAVLATGLLATVALAGGAAAIQGAGTPTPAPSVSATPSAAQEQRLPDAPQEAEQSPEAGDQDGPGQGAKPGKGPKPGRGPEPGEAHEGARGPVPEVAFTCDPSKSHGQNVSAYVHSLPKGPGRGRQVSQVAKSDCGKTR